MIERLLIVLGHVAESPDRAGFFPTLVMGALCALVVPLYMVWASLVVYRKARRLSRSAGDKLAGKLDALVPGPAVVHGVVESEDGSSAPVVSIESEFEQRTAVRKGEEKQVWMLRRVRNQARAFYLRLPSGESLRVVPGDRNVLVLDDEDRHQQLSETVKVRAIDVTPGESFFVVGEVNVGDDPRAQAQGYRGVRGASLVMEAPPYPRTMMLSKDPPSRVFARTARGSLAALGFALAVLVGMNTLAYGSFWLMTLNGTVVQATVTQVTPRTWRYRGRSHEECYVTARAEINGVARELSDSTSMAVCSDPVTFAPGRGRVPFVIARSAPSVYAIGDDVSGHLEMIIMTSIFLVFAWIGWLVLRWVTRAPGNVATE